MTKRLKHDRLIIDAYYNYDRITNKFLKSPFHHSFIRLIFLFHIRCSYSVHMDCFDYTKSWFIVYLCYTNFENDDSMNIPTRITIDCQSLISAVRQDQCLG